MKINPLDAHDRFQYFTKQQFSIAECCQDLINKRPFGDYPFYIFAHARTADDGANKRLIWQPRLTKPKAQSNSMLFKAYPGSDVIKIIWMIPAKELWGQYQKGLLTENKTVTESIYNFINHREKLEAKEEDDLSDEKIDAIYFELSSSIHSTKMMDKLYLDNTKQRCEEASSASSE
jgi:hypothetical protein